MNFFERLREEAMRKVEKLHIPASLDSLQAVQATVEALKEMMVGEPIPMTLEHEDMGPKTSTFLVDMNDELHARWDGYKGTDGEKVTVLVVRLS